MFRGRYFSALLGAIETFVPIGFFVYYLLSLGLDPLPNSVQAKLVSNDDAGMGIVTRIFGTVIINLVKFGGLAISTLAVAVMVIASLTLTTQNRTSIFVGALARAGAICVLAYNTYATVTYDKIDGVMVMVLIFGLVILALNLFRSLREHPENNGMIWFSLALAGAGIGHVFLAQTGWMERYEHYAISYLALGLVILAGLAPTARRLAATFAVVAIALTGARYVEKTALDYHWGSRAIHLQQFQMQRFAKEFLNKPVAVNDLGWVVWGNDNYVLDLFGLANHEARHLRLYENEQGWGGPLVKRHNVSVIMIYHNFVEDAVAPEWVPLGVLTMDNAKGFLGDDIVHFYASDYTEVPTAEAALREWVKTLLPDTCFRRADTPGCWTP